MWNNLFKNIFFSFYLPYFIRFNQRQILLRLVDYKQCFAYTFFFIEIYN